MLATADGSCAKPIWPAPGNTLKGSRVLLEPTDGPYGPIVPGFLGLVAIQALESLPGQPAESFTHGVSVDHDAALALRAWSSFPQDNQRIGQGPCSVCPSPRSSLATTWHGLIPGSEGRPQGLLLPGRRCPEEAPKPARQPSASSRSAWINSAGHRRSSVHVPGKKSCLTPLYQTGRPSPAHGCPSDRTRQGSPALLTIRPLRNSSRRLSLTARPPLEQRLERRSMRRSCLRSKRKAGSPATCPGRLTKAWDCTVSCTPAQGPPAGLRIRDRHP